MNKFKHAERLNYNPETGSLRWADEQPWGARCTPGAEVGHIAGDGYRKFKIKKIEYYAHVVAWQLYYNEIPPDLIDHENQNKADNRIENLRAATVKDNAHNQKLRKNSPSKTLGVRYVPSIGKWRATISGLKKDQHLGLFFTEEEAIAARKKAEEQFDYHPNHGKCK